MKILAIETSCDETAVSIVDATSDADAPQVNILAQVVTSQLAIHAHWGGVVPNIAKREHQRALIPALEQALENASLRTISNDQLLMSKETDIKKILERETELLPEFLKFVSSTAVPDIDAIAVTQGPGLEPALWVGVNCARALSLAWDKPLIPVNHMEGHFVSALINVKKSDLQEEVGLREITYPAVALLVSGGHTEIVLSEKQGSYKILGKTRDDAVGEAFDKVARILGLPYPGGPAISKLADTWTSNVQVDVGRLPRPMIRSGDYDFSFSGLKTAVLYLVRDLGGIEKINDEMKAAIAHEFQEAALEVLVSKTKSAAEEYGAETIIVGGGVSANKRLREKFNAKTSDVQGDVRRLILFPAPELSTDNATMIALAAYCNQSGGKEPGGMITAQGNLML